MRGANAASHLHSSITRSQGFSSFAQDIRQLPAYRRCHEERARRGSGTIRGTPPMIGWFVLLLIAALIALSWLRTRLRAIDDALLDQQRTIDALSRKLEAIEREAAPAPP